MSKVAADVLKPWISIYKLFG